MAWTPSSQCFLYRNTAPTCQPVSEVSPIWQQIQKPPPGVRVLEELGSDAAHAADIGRHHVILSAPADAVPDASVPPLQADAAKWRSLSSSMPGMEPEMVQVADLLICTDAFMTSELNTYLEQEGMETVAHVSQLFSRINSKYRAVGEVSALRAAADKFFRQFGVSQGEVAMAGEQWGLAMKWRSKRVAFAHPLLGVNGGIDLQRLNDLESAVSTQPGYATVKLAAGAMVKAAKQLMNGA